VSVFPARYIHGKHKTYINQWERQLRQKKNIASGNIVTIVRENVLLHKLLDKLKAAAGGGVVGVGEATSPERRRELCLRTDDLRPEPLELHLRVVIPGVLAVTEHKIIEQEEATSIWRRKCGAESGTTTAATNGTTDRNGRGLRDEKRHGNVTVTTFCNSE
jgi:hypothetical protein